MALTRYNKKLSHSCATTTNLSQNCENAVVKLSLVLSTTFENRHLLSVIDQFPRNQWECYFLQSFCKPPWDFMFWIELQLSKAELVGRWRRVWEELWERKGATWRPDGIRPPVLYAKHTLWICSVTKQNTRYIVNYKCQFVLDWNYFDI